MVCDDIHRNEADSERRYHSQVVAVKQVAEDMFKIKFRKGLTG